MEWMTASVTDSPGGRGPKLGDGQARACRHQPPVQSSALDGPTSGLRRQGARAGPRILAHAASPAASPSATSSWPTFSRVAIGTASPQAQAQGSAGGRQVLAMLAHGLLKDVPDTAEEGNPGQTAGPPAATPAVPPAGFAVCRREAPTGGSAEPRSRRDAAGLGHRFSGLRQGHGRRPLSVALHPVRALPPVVASLPDRVDPSAHPRCPAPRPGARGSSSRMLPGKRCRASHDQCAGPRRGTGLTPASWATRFSKVR